MYGIPELSEPFAVRRERIPPGIRVSDKEVKQSFGAVRDLKSVSLQEQVIAMYDDGFDYAEIMKELNIPKGRVHSIVSNSR